MERTLPKYAPSILPLLIIGHSKSHFLPLGLNEKKVLILQTLSSFCTAMYHQHVRGLASHQCKFHFDSIYGRLDTPYSSYNMKIAKEGPLDV